MRQKSRRMTVIINVAIIALLCYVICSLIVLQLGIASYRSKLSELNAQKEEQSLLNEEMEALLEEGTDADYIIKMAREKLGLIFPEERVYFNASGQ